MVLYFKNWINLNEMASRRSLLRTMLKFIDASKPAAILTAFRGKLFDDGKLLGEKERLKRNRQANRHLQINLKQRKLSYFPVKGVGQEEDEFGGITHTNEESFVVQPIENMDEQQFLDHIREILFDPIGDPQHRQWGAVVKLPSLENGFLLHQTEKGANSPSDYTGVTEIGTARPATPDDIYKTRVASDKDFSFGD